MVPLFHLETLEYFSLSLEFSFSWHSEPFMVWLQPHLFLPWLNNIQATIPSLAHPSGSLTLGLFIQFSACTGLPPPLHWKLTHFSRPSINATSSMKSSSTHQMKLIPFTSPIPYNSVPLLKNWHRRPNICLPYPQPPRGLGPNHGHFG